jgi:Domain of unknown function (DUF4157)
MTTQLLTESNAFSGRTFTPVPSGLVQRKCATCGNHTVAGGECTDCKKLKPSSLQTMLTINEPSDRYEQEADRIADQVMAMPAHSTISRSPLNIQRFCGESSGQGNEVPERVSRVLASSGRPLEAGLRQDMEGRFGHDFSQVRVHAGDAAGKSALDISARAYTVGNNVVFGEGQYQSDSLEGRRLIAHELTHVVQQSKHFSDTGFIQRAGECSRRNGFNCNGVTCTTATGRRGRCSWGGLKYGCNCRDTSGDEPRPSRIQEMLPSWLLYLLSAAAIAAIAACFATGVCEFGLVVAGLGTATAAAVIAILNAAGIRDSGSSETEA